MDKCTICGNELVLGVNWPESYQRNRSKQCQPCKRSLNRDFQKTYRDKHRNDPEYIAKDNEHSRKYRAEHRAELNAYGRIWSKGYIQEKKRTVISHYSDGKNVCSCCLETYIEFLTIDHIYGNGGKHRNEVARSGITFYRWLIKNNFPSGFRVLCFNCNHSYGHYGYCPHQTH